LVLAEWIEHSGSRNLLQPIISRFPGTTGRQQNGELGAVGESRTRMPFRAERFKCSVSAIPPRPRNYSYSLIKSLPYFRSTYARIGAIKTLSTISTGELSAEVLAFNKSRSEQ
jgi:hypothetical protein